MSWIEHVSWCLCFMIYLIWIFPKDWRALLINIFKARHRLIIKIPLLCGTALWAAGLRPGYRIHWLLVMLWDECICPGVLFGRILSLKAFTLPDLLWCRIPGPQGFEERSVQCLRPSWPTCSRTGPKVRPAQQHGPAGCHRGLCDLSGLGPHVEPYPLVTAGEHNIPLLLTLPGTPTVWLGDLRCEPAEATLSRWVWRPPGCEDRGPLVGRGTQRLQKTPAADRTMQCFVYNTTTYPAEWVPLPDQDNSTLGGSREGLRWIHRKTDKRLEECSPASSDSSDRALMSIRLPLLGLHSLNTKA